MGLFPLTPGEPRYIVTTPMTPRATIRAHKSNILRPTAAGALELNGRAVTTRFVEHRAIAE